MEARFRAQLGNGRGPRERRRSLMLAGDPTSGTGEDVALVLFRRTWMAKEVLGRPRFDLVDRRCE